MTSCHFFSDACGALSLLILVIHILALVPDHRYYRVYFSTRSTNVAGVKGKGAHVCAHTLF